jgi:hypothetical protein
VDEAYCHGNWKETTTDSSSATICVPPPVIERICLFKDLEVEYASGGRGSKRRVKCIRSLEATSLVFQSPHKGGPMNDGNIRNRHLKPAALKLGIDPKKRRARCRTRSARDRKSRTLSLVAHRCGSRNFRCCLLARLPRQPWRYLPMRPRDHVARKFIDLAAFGSREFLPDDGRDLVAGESVDGFVKLATFCFTCGGNRHSLFLSYLLRM